jgi:hypothetical protein
MDRRSSLETVLPPHSSREALDQALRDLESSKSAWASLRLSKRIEILEQLIRNSAAVAERIVSSSIKAKGLPVDGIGAAQEMIAGPYVVVRNLRRFLWALKDIDARGTPRVPGPITTRPNGRVVARVGREDRPAGAVPGQAKAGLVRKPRQGGQQGF